VLNAAHGLPSHDDMQACCFWSTHIDFWPPCLLGASVGLEVGAAVGLSVGGDDGLIDGTMEGAGVGKRDGSSVGE
jgi:hypothetical protein